MHLEDETAEKIPTAFWKAVMDRYARIGIGHAFFDMCEQREYHEHMTMEDEDVCEVCG